jgi:hypothetical protein
MRSVQGHCSLAGEARGLCTLEVGHFSSTSVLKTLATAPAPQSQVRCLYREEVATVADNVWTALPAATGRIEKAVQLILAGDAKLLPDGSAMVASQSNAVPSALRTLHGAVTGQAPAQEAQ